MFNDKIEKVARIFYTQQLKILLNDMTLACIRKETVAVVAVNAALAVILFFVAVRRKGLE